ncbi:MAG: hypothetical protein ACT4PV_07165 [Planctomycetaceae bacterium]
MKRSPAPLPHVSAERGVALILVLIVLPLVAIVVTQLHFETTLGARLARNNLANQQFKGAILLRLEQMRQILVRDLADDEKNAQEGAYDHGSDSWGSEADGGGVALVVKKGDGDRGDEIEIYTQVADEQGKLNLNLLRHRDAPRRGLAFQRFRTLLDLFRDARYGDLAANAWDLAPEQAAEVAEAVRKFLDGEARDERLPKPVVPQPSAEMQQGIYTLDDLVFCHPLMIEKRLLETFHDPESGQTIPGLTRFLTLFGDGKINANTASIQVLRALFKDEEGQGKLADALLHGRGGFLNTEEDRLAQEEAEEERRMAREDPLAPQPAAEEADAVYKTLNDIGKVEGFQDQGLMRHNDIDFARDFTVRSNFFLVTLTARRENFVRQHRVVLQRHATGTVTWESEVRAADAAELPTGGGAGEGTDAPGT